RLADPDQVSKRARQRGANQVGTLGSGNHFIEVQVVDDILAPDVAKGFGLRRDQVVVLIHTGSRGLGHQVCTDQLPIFQRAAKKYGIKLVDRQLACAPATSVEGSAYLGAMAAAANFAWANRQVIMHQVREALSSVFGRDTHARLVYDVAHNLAKVEHHQYEGRKRKLVVHRKGATRAFGPNHPELPSQYAPWGQPVFIPGSMGTSSYVLVGTEKGMKESFGSVCHGAGRKMSRSAARRAVNPNKVIRALAKQGIAVRAGSKKGIAEEYPGAYKDVVNVVDVVEGAGLSRKVARLRPLAVIKG
ncbi:MAG: RtcB family protein, partial [Proteobacteria bacterium]|nr:RtcB family protein [Pseudomonadota bacterium]